MDDGSWPLIRALLTAAAMGLVLLSGLHMRRARGSRKRSLQQWATGLGFAFDPRSIEGYDKLHGHKWFRPNMGEVGLARFTVTGCFDVGDDECAITMGDYASQRQSRGLDSHTRNEGSFLICDLPWVAVPDLLIRPAKFGDGARTSLGAQDLDVGPRGFSERYVVQSSNPDFAQALVTPALAMFLEAEEPTSVEIVYDELLVTSASGRWVTWEAEKFAERLEWTRRFLERWPSRAVAMLAPKESQGPRG